MDNLRALFNPDEEAEDARAHHPMHEHDLSDGGEFLDDGVRMKDQPFDGDDGVNQ